MNKLFVIKFMIRDIVVSVKNFWNDDDAVSYMCGCGNDAWKFKLEENNDIHKIWIAR